MERKAQGNKDTAAKLNALNFNMPFLIGYQSKDTSSYTQIKQKTTNKFMKTIN